MTKESLTNWGKERRQGRAGWWVLRSEVNSEVHG